MRRKETVSFAAAYGGERVLAYLFLPRGAEPPYQTVVWYPGDDAFFLPAGGWTRVIPVFLALHAVGLVGTCLLYRWVIQRQGELLQEREQHILDVLTRD